MILKSKIVLMIAAAGLVAGCNKSSAPSAPETVAQPAPQKEPGTPSNGGSPGTKQPVQPGADGTPAPQGKPGLGSLVTLCDDGGRALADGPWIDPGTNLVDCSGLSTVYNAIKTADIKATEGSHFDKLFAGTSAAATMKFLNERVHYVVPSNVSFKLTFGADTREIPGGKGGVVAANLGMAFWMIDTKFGGKEAGIKYFVGSTPINPTAPANGFVHLGESFVKFDIIQRMSTMIHEARHSDCEALTSEVCGLPHAKCPTGHAYADMNACEDKAVGPYFTEAVYEQALQQSCKNCSETEMQVALIAAAESLTRVLNLKEIMDSKETRLKVDMLPGFEPKAHRESLKSVFESRRIEAGVRK